MPTTATTAHRRIRYAAAAGSAVVAILYLLTGTGAVAVTRDQPAGVVPPLLIAAGLFTVLTVALLLIDRQWLWITGAAFQVPLLLMYLVVAAERVPAFEAWGITVKALQVALLGALVALALRRTVLTPPGAAARVG